MRLTTERKATCWLSLSFLDRAAERDEELYLRAIEIDLAERNHLSPLLKELLCFLAVICALILWKARWQGSRTKSHSLWDKFQLWRSCKDRTPVRMSVSASTYLVTRLQTKLHNCKPKSSVLLVVEQDTAKVGTCLPPHRHTSTHKIGIFYVQQSFFLQTTEATKTSGLERKTGRKDPPCKSSSCLEGIVSICLFFSKHIWVFTISKLLHCNSRKWKPLRFGLFI